MSNKFIKMKSSRPSSLCLALALAVSAMCSGASAYAQSTFGTLLGTVTDNTGAAVTGATVVVVNESTGIQRTIVSEGQGDYRFVNIEPGTYTVTISAPNLSTVKDEHVIVPARETVRTDVSLSLKAVGQETTVFANQEVISEDLTVSDSKSGIEVSSLPLNFRATTAPSPINVAALSPTVNLDSSGNLTFAGQLPTATSFSLDGVSIQSVRYGGPNKDLFPSVEGIAEFRVNTAGGSAEYAQPTDLTVTTRGGGNQFHGSAYWFAQRKGWDSTDLIAQQSIGANANDYGVSIGGPIWKDHTFFYFDYETDRLGQNTLIQTQTVPTAWLTGDFTGVTDQSATTPFVLYAAPGVPLPTKNLGAVATINPATAQILPNFFPAATNSSNNIDVTGNNLVTVFPGSYKLDGYDGRIDHTFSPKHSIFGRITDKNITSAGTDSATGDSTYNPLMGTFTTTTDLVNLALSHNWVINSALVNEARGGFTTANYSYSYPQALQGNALIKTIGITGTPGPPANGLGGVPAFFVGDFLGGATNNFGHPRISKNTIVEVADNLSWTHGRFYSKFGGDYRHLSYQDNITFFTGDEYGDYTITGGYDSQGVPCTPAELKLYANACAAAQLYLGLIDYATQAQNGPDGKPHDQHFDFFGQTEFKVNQQLTIHAGLRYELNTPFIDSTNQLGNFDTSVPGGRLIVNPNEKINPIWAQAVGSTPFVLNSAPGVGLPSGLRFLDKSNIQPRLGFSYKPLLKSDSIIKASVGEYSVPVLGAVLYSLLGVDTSYYGAYSPSASTPVFNFQNVFSSAPGQGTAYPGYRRANQFNLKDPRVVQWNLAFEQNIGAKTLLRASYTGSHTYDLIYSPDLNQVAPNTTGLASGTAALNSLTPTQRAAILKFPNFNEVLTRANGPSARYNAYIFEVNRRFSQGVSFTNAYTVAYNKTNALGTAPNSAIPTGGQGDNGGNVQNIYDIKSDTGNAYYDPRQKLLSTVVYDLPYGRGQKFGGDSSKIADLFLGGWSTTGIFLFHTGNFLTPYYPSGVSDSSGTNPSERSVSAQRPDCVIGGDYNIKHSIAKFFNSAPYTIPGNDIGRFGNCGVGVLTGPKTTTLSMSIGKNFNLTERFGLRYESQFSNLFNITNWGQPNVNVSSSSFGLITASQPNNGSQAGPRTIQMSLRLKF